VSVPKTTAYVRILRQSLWEGQIEGEVSAGSYKWSFEWQFRQSRLIVQPSLGRALIRDPLERFLERCDYQLEPGGDYEFIVRAKL